MQRTFLIEELEPRILLSADLPLHSSSDDDFQTVVLSSAGLAQPAPTDPETSDAAATAAIAERREIVFIDSRVADDTTLIDDLLAQRDARRDIEIVRIEADRDGLGQITSILAERRDVGAIHIVSHGAAGELLLGSGTITADSLTAKADVLADWAWSLTRT